MNENDNGVENAPNLLTIHYNDDPPGSGKSQYFKDLVAEEPARYLLAVPTRALMAEHAEGPRGIRRSLDDAGLARVEVIAISTESHRGGVRRAVAEAAEVYRDRAHVVVLVTHEALTTSDLSAYAGWTLLVDEVPNVVACGTWRTAGSRAFFGANFRLDPVPGGGGAWSRVAAKADAPGFGLIARDDLVGAASTFAKRARSASGVYARLPDWGAMEDGEAWPWWPVWEVAEAAAFDRVLLVGNAFSTSLSRRLMEQRPGDGWRVAFARFPIPVRAEPRLPRRVAIRYFTEHPGSTTFWTKHAEGRRCIGAVAEWIAANVPARGHLYATNTAIEAAMVQARVPGLRVSPVQAGSNAYDDIEHLSILYSAKLTPEEEKALALGAPRAEEGGAGRRRHVPAARAAEEGWRRRGGSPVTADRALVWRSGAYFVIDVGRHDADVVRDWCIENCDGDFVIDLGRRVMFALQSDCALAMLTFC